MSDSDQLSNLALQSKYLLHPTDFSEQSEFALAHAIRYAANNQGQLELLHVGKDNDESWDEFPSIRKHLARWGLIDHDAPRSAVGDLGIGVRKTISNEGNLAQAVESYSQHHRIDLVVLSTAGRTGISSWIKPSKAEKIANALIDNYIPTLFVPRDCRGCVDLNTGEVTMENILVPVDHHPSSESAVERGLAAIKMFGNAHSQLTLLHVGSASNFPEVPLPNVDWDVRRVVREGNPAAEILATAEEIEANLIIMVTDGEQGFLDVLRGTTTEQVIRQAPCPLLAVPAGL